MKYSKYVLASLAGLAFVSANAASTSCELDDTCYFQGTVGGNQDSSSDTTGNRSLVYFTVNKAGTYNCSLTINNSNSKKQYKSAEANVHAGKAARFSPQNIVTGTPASINVTLDKKPGSNKDGGQIKFGLVEDVAYPANVIGVTCSLVA